MQKPNRTSLRYTQSITKHESLSTTYWDFYKKLCWCSPDFHCGKKKSSYAAGSKIPGDPCRNRVCGCHGHVGARDNKPAVFSVGGPPV